MDFLLGCLPWQIQRRQQRREARRLADAADLAAANEAGH